MYEKVAIITKIWHRAKYYFTSMSDDCTKYKQNYHISQQTLKIYEKIAIIT